ncbi:hypothetical protein ABMA28_009504 [Loxostege sticticalis]|uniref:Gustatory receptor n=1 Tax=Loxostege sticticalis TaxID=481309 RepID=A0ABD0SDJ4_LOXSC
MPRFFDVGQSEYLLYNAIDPDIKKFFDSLTFPQMIFFLSKFTIRDNFITEKSLFSIFLSLWNWIIIIIYISGYLMFICPNVIYYFTFISIQFSCNLIFCFVLDMNIFYVMRIIKLLRVALEEWVSDPCFSTLNETRNCDWISKMSVYVHILEVFEITKQVYQMSMLYHITDSFAHTVLYVQYFVELFREYSQINDDSINSPLMFLLLWLSKSVFIHSGLCLECELFYIAVRDSEVACWKILQSGKCTEQERRICKNILRTRRTELDSFRACGMYLAGAQLPMRLVSLIRIFLQVSSVPTPYQLNCLVKKSEIIHEGSTYNEFRRKTITVLTFDINILIATRLISLLKSQLLSWTTEIQNFAVIADEDFTIYARREEILRSFFDIISAFNLFKQAFQVMMKLAVIYIVIWQLKVVCIHSGLCIECELFYIAVRDSEVACSELLHSGKFTEQERRICKNILRTRRTELDSFRACGMYLAGAQLPMRLVSLIANCTIVLLQFAFVK